MHKSRFLYNITIKQCECVCYSFARTTPKPNQFKPLFRTRPSHRVYATVTSDGLARPPTRWRFRPIPAFAALLLAQLVVLWDVSSNTDMFEKGDSGKFLSSSEFLPYTVIHKDVVSPNSCILTLRPGSYTGPVENVKGGTLDSWRYRLQRGLGHPPKLTKKDLENLKAYQDDLWRDGIWSIEIKQPQMSIARRYTPLPPMARTSTSLVGLTSSASNDQDPGIFRLFIRREPEGEVSRYLYDQTEGATIEIRGGFPEYSVPTDVTHLAFIAGGTGIAPALSAAYSLVLRQTDLNMQILWANRRREDCAGVPRTQSNDFFFTSLLRKLSLLPQQADIEPSPTSCLQTAAIVRQLEDLQHLSTAPHVNTKYFIDEENSFIGKQDIIRALESSSESGITSPVSKRLILVSGPEGFVDHVAGRKIISNGREYQGPQGGILSQLDLGDWQIWKL